MARLKIPYESLDPLTIGSADDESKVYREELELEVAARCAVPATDSATWLGELAGSRRAVAIRIEGELRWIAIEDAARYRDALGVPLPAGLTVANASATRFMSSPACSAIAMPSARLAICTAPIRLLISLKTVPVPTAPKCLITSPIGAR